MGKVCRVALVPVLDGWVLEAGIVAAKWRQSARLCHGVVDRIEVSSKVWWCSLEQRARDAERAAACIHLWPARGASAAQGRCAAWRSLVTWRGGCTHPRPSRMPPLQCLYWQSCTLVLAYKFVLWLKFYMKSCTYYIIMYIYKYMMLAVC